MTSIFLSHNSRDKYFVRKLKDDLERDGIMVWFDEDEMKVGDSLIGKISEGITTMDYVGVILSKNSVESEWVKKEVAIAMTQEIKGKKVKVLPILFENCDIPPFLIDKIYADFTKTFIDGYRVLLRVLAPNKNILKDMSEEEVDRLIGGAPDIYSPEELKEILTKSEPLTFLECEKLAKSIKIFENNQTIILDYVSNMSLAVAESLKNHSYPFEDLCECYLRHLDNLFKTHFSFGLLDTFSDFLRLLLKVIEKFSLRIEIFKRIRNMGRDFSRWYVMGSFANIVGKVQTKQDVKALYDILKDASIQEIDEYLVNAKSDLSIKLLTTLKKL